MIKNIIRQLLHIAKRLYAQLSNSEIVRIVKAWAVRLLGEKDEQPSKAPQQKAIQKAQQKSNTNAPTPSLVQQMQQFINDRWNLRFNELENNIELQDKSGENADFQLKTEIMKGKPLYITKEEEQEIEQHNKGYYKFSPVNDVFSRYYITPGSFTNLQTDKSISWLSASELFDELKAQAPHALQGITIKRITKEMRRLGAPRRHLSEGNVWGMKKISV